MSKPARRAGTVQRALDAARQDRGDLMLAAVQRLASRTEFTASSQGLWLAAESAYLHGAYTIAIDLFDRWEWDPRSRRSARWLRYMSSHRRASAHLHIGRYRESRRCLLEAEARLTGPDYRQRQSDLDLLRGRLREWHDDPVGARAHFRWAHEHAAAAGNWTAVAAAALELTRVSLFRRDGYAASRWIRRAEAALRRGADSRLRLLLNVRSAAAQVSCDGTESALRLLDGVVGSQAWEMIPTDWRIETLIQRSDALLRCSQVDRARADLEQAAAIACGHGLRPLLVTIDHTRALLARLEGSKDGTARAAIHFTSALSTAVSTDAPHGGLIRQLAEDVIMDPGLLGRETPPVEACANLAAILSRVEVTDRVDTFLRAGRDHPRDDLRDRLSAQLARMTEPPVQLAECTVRTLTRQVVSSAGIRRFGRAQLAVFEALCESRDEPLTLADLAETLELDECVISKRLERLHEALGDDLVVLGGGRAKRRYALRRPAAVMAGAAVTGTTRRGRHER